MTRNIKRESAGAGALALGYWSSISLRHDNIYLHDSSELFTARHCSCLTDVALRHAYRTVSSERVLPLELLLDFVLVYAQTFSQ